VTFLEPSPLWPLPGRQMEKMEKTLESVKGNFNTVRTGRANPSLLDRVEVRRASKTYALKSGFSTWILGASF